jgi:hypothetical protein
MLANKVDVTRTNLTNPYYDNGFAADSRNFVDTSRRPDVEFENSWIASLFLTSGAFNPGTAATPAQITVYNDSGILWGWQNFFFPNINEQQFVQDVQQDVFGQNQLGLVTLDLDLGTPQTFTFDLIPTSDYAFYEQAFLSSVPELSTWMMLLVGMASLLCASYYRQRALYGRAIPLH